MKKNPVDKNLVFASAVKLQKSGRKDDIVKCIKLLRKAAILGHPSAQVFLGAYYENGVGVKKDLPNAMSWYYQAAQAGCFDAMHRLACLICEHPTKKYTLKQALGYLKRVILNDPTHLEARYAYARCLLENSTEFKDLKTARQHLTIAASEGLTDAQFSLSVAFSRGRFGKINMKKAFYWAQIAAQKGDVDAVNNLGWYYENGLGVKKNLKTAINLYRRAAKKGSVLAGNNLRRVSIRSEA